MARKNEFSNGHIDIDREISAVELMRLCKIALNHDLGAVVTIRQTEGTDFPPFITIETQEVHDMTDAEGIAVNQLA
jgi:hypothetical protein